MSHPDSRHSWEIPMFSFLDLQRMEDKLQNKRDKIGVSKWVRNFFVKET